MSTQVVVQRNLPLFCCYYSSVINSSIATSALTSTRSLRSSAEYRLLTSGTTTLRQAFVEDLHVLLLLALLFKGTFFVPPLYSSVLSLDAPQNPCETLRGSLRLYLGDRSVVIKQHTLFEEAFSTLGYLYLPSSAIVIHLFVTLRP